MEKVGNGKADIDVKFSRVEKYLCFTGIDEDKQIKITIEDENAKLIAFDKTGKKIDYVLENEDGKTILLLNTSSDTIFLSVDTTEQDKTVSFEYVEEGYFGSTFYVGSTSKGKGDGSSPDNCIDFKDVNLSKDPYLQDDLTFILVDDVELESGFSLSENIAQLSEITIKSKDNEKHRLTSSDLESPIILIGEDSADITLNLKNLIIGPDDDAEEQHGTTLISVSSGIINIEECTLENGSSTGGGGLYITNATAKIKDSLIQNNSSEDNGGGVYAVGSGTDVTIEGALTSIKGNNATSDGAGVYATGKANVTVKDKATIEGNTAAEKGGGIYATDDGTEITIEGESTSIKGNNAKNGGGIYVEEKAKVTVKDGAKIEGNEATNDENNTSFCRGGGIYAKSSAKVTITEAEISNNKATNESANGWGGGIYATGDNTSITITNSDICGNESTLSGGGICADTGSEVTITDGKITENEAGMTGGGIRVNDGSTVNLEGDYLITGNKAGNNGGGVYVASGGKCNVTTVGESENKIKQNTVLNQGSSSDNYYKDNGEGEEPTKW